MLIWDLILDNGAARKANSNDNKCSVWKDHLNINVDILGITGLGL